MNIAFLEGLGQKYGKPEPDPVPNLKARVRPEPVNSEPVPALEDTGYSKLALGRIVRLSVKVNSELKSPCHIKDSNFPRLHLIRTMIILRKTSVCLVDTHYLGLNEIFSPYSYG